MTKIISLQFCTNHPKYIFWSTLQGHILFLANFNDFGDKLNTSASSTRLNKQKTLTLRQKIQYSKLAIFCLNYKIKKLLRLISLPLADVPENEKIIVDNKSQTVAESTKELLSEDILSQAIKNEQHNAENG